MNILEVRELKKYYGEGENQVKALDGVSVGGKGRVPCGGGNVRQR